MHKVADEVQENVRGKTNDSQIAPNVDRQGPTSQRPETRQIQELVRAKIIVGLGEETRH